MDIMAINAAMLVVAKEMAASLKRKIDDCLNFAEKTQRI